MVSRNSIYEYPMEGCDFAELHRIMIEARKFHKEILNLVWNIISSKQRC